MAKKSTALKGSMTFSTRTVALFVLVFAVVGGYAIFKSFAAKLPPQNSGVCNLTSPVTVGQNYSGTITNLPANTVLNMFTTYGDGTTWDYALGSTTDGVWNIMSAGTAKVAGTTTFQVTGKTKSNPKLTPVYATCYVQVNQN